MKAAAAALLILLLSIVASLAQSTVSVIGPVAPGHCVAFFSTTQIQDAGGVCAGVTSVTGTAGQITVSPTTGAVVVGLVTPLSLANGGTNNAALAASAGGIVWSDASKLNVLAGTVTAGQCLMSGSSAAPAWGSCGSGGGVVASVGNAAADTSLTIAGTGTGPWTGAVTAKINLANAQIWTGPQTFANSDILLRGSSTGTTTFTSANAGASNFTLTFPAVTANLAYLVGTPVTGNCVKFSGTVGGITDSGAACGGGGGTPGGANTNVQFNNSGAFGGDSGFTYTTPGQVTIALGSVTTNVKALNITGTLNAVGTTFDAPLFMNIVNTASAAASKLVDLQVGGTAFLSANGDGSVFINQVTGALTVTALTVSYQGTARFQFNAFGSDLNINNVASTGLTFGAVQGRINFAGSSVLSDDGSFHLELRNGANPLTFRVYNTADAGTGVPTNYERAVLDWTANTLTVGTQKAGTGSARAMNLVTGGTNAITVSTAQLVALPAITTDATHVDSTVCQDTTTHALYFGSGSAGICLGTSSLRFKHDVAALDVGLDQIMRLRPIRYRLNADHGDPHKVLYGFSAEQGQTALPELTGNDEEGQPNTFDYLGVVPVLVRAAQQQQAEIEQLKKDIPRHVRR